MIGRHETWEPPERTECWGPYHPGGLVPPDRRGLLPPLCGEACRADWVATYSLRDPDDTAAHGPATHTVTDRGWRPITATAPASPAVPITQVAPDPTPRSLAEPHRWLADLLRWRR